MNGPSVVVITHTAGSDDWEVRVPVRIPSAALIWGLRTLPSGLGLNTAGPDVEDEEALLFQFTRLNPATARDSKD